jgi:hypothetical protein
VQEVQCYRGEARLSRIDRIETMSDEHVSALFHGVRAAEYQAVLQGCREVTAQIDCLKSADRGSVPQVRTRLDGRKRELDRVQAIDSLDSPIGQRATTLDDDDGLYSVREQKS